MSKLWTICKGTLTWVGGVKRKGLHRIITRNSFLHTTTTSRSRTRPVEEHPHWLEMHGCKTKSELITQLMEHPIYQDNHIIVLNKPGGIPMIGPKYGSAEYMEVPEGEELSIAAVLPDIQKVLGCPVLEVIYSQPRLYSGIFVLSKSEHASSTLAKYFKHTRINKVFFQTYWALTVGSPNPPACEREQIGLRMEYIEGWKLTVKEKQATPRQRRLKNVVVSEMSLKTLCTHKASQHSVSLVELSLTLLKWDAMQLFLLHKLAPVLGDHKYSARLKDILGRPALMDHASHLPSPQVLPFGLQKDLGISTHQDAGFVPLHMHCYQLDIPRVVATRSHRTSPLLHLQAPLPQFFRNSMNRLHLHYGPDSQQSESS